MGIKEKQKSFSDEIKLRQQALHSGNKSEYGKHNENAFKLLGELITLRKGKRDESTV